MKPAKVDQFDLVVVGAGIVGTMTAFLATDRRPDARVLLVDQGLVGNGASAFSAGFDVPLVGSEDHREFVRRGTAIYGELRESMPDLPVRQLDVFAVVDAGRVAALEKRVEGTELRPATDDESTLVRENYPDLVVSDEQTLLRMTAGGYCGSVRTVAERLVAVSRKSTGFASWAGMRVAGVFGRDETTMLRFGGGIEVAADQVVFATGPWIADGCAGITNTGIRVKKVAALHIERRPRPDAPALLFPDEDAFLLPLQAEGRWLFSFASREWDVRPREEELTIDDDDRRRAFETLHRYAPSFARAVRGGRVWCDGYSVDRVPLIRRVTDHPRVVLAGGCSGSGFRLAPAIAEKALELSGAPAMPNTATPDTAMTNTSDQGSPE
ncbi:glycine/D-amino acid oxidase-like deaminating enzyme [Herbihabitans rhizosphaerae]|uniref:Glycine/D-amino acid oxidase-like deaminating enzyme n=1 Tax=Herbihabitans rhizosphaerae TaxID=1872711 RepID=A0A4Q7KG53_9PSEU|nr:FAD-binding oxidoreductase [Herbihabitans rhizosphaerae]RZS34223.1 glycine/D-amino acid oxidase-like deaminating enzyme [Herbihabitans rhizosphaerae]